MFVMTLRSEVELLLANGLSPTKIARRLGVARPTVEYHLDRIAAADRSAPVRGLEPPEARTQIPTRQRVVDLLNQGLARSSIAKQLGLSKATVSYHARRAGAPIDSRCARRYDWTVIQSYYDEGHSLSECRAQFGFASETWNAAVKRGAVVPRPVRMPTDQFFAAGVHRGRGYLKLRLVQEGHRQARCECCGLREWRGRAQSVVLHHINGNRDDNRLENLQLLCPNCHSQTDTFSGRNGHRRRSR
jgi:DNA-binding CsgD family transcriptional regulator/5-methylcytosine-specific restriction endonuclease McrA